MNPNARQKYTHFVLYKHGIDTFNAIFRISGATPPKGSPSTTPTHRPLPNSIRKPTAIDRCGLTRSRIARRRRWRWEGCRATSSVWCCGWSMPVTALRRLGELRALSCMGWSTISGCSGSDSFQPRLISLEPCSCGGSSRSWCKPSYWATATTSKLIDWRSRFMRQKNTSELRRHCRTNTRSRSWCLEDSTNTARTTKTSFKLCRVPSKPYTSTPSRAIFGTGWPPKTQGTGNPPQRGRHSGPPAPKIATPRPPIARRRQLATLTLRIGGRVGFGNWTHHQGQYQQIRHLWPRLAFVRPNDGPAGGQLAAANSPRGTKQSGAHLARFQPSEQIAELPGCLAHNAG